MQQEIFPIKETLNSKWYLFKKATDLGKIYDSIPWEGLSNCLPAQLSGQKGAPRWFSNQGMLGLMFLKSYTGLSEEKLIARFNTDWSFQYFCGRKLSDTEMIRDVSIVSRIRNYLAENADLTKLQTVMLKHWKSDMNNTHILFMDATCYESYVRFPTDVKLLWESCVFIYEKLLFKICKTLGQKRPRSKYNEQKKKQQNYQKLKRKSYKKGRARKRSLLHLLEKGLGLLQEILNQHPDLQLDQKQYAYIKIIKKVLFQQTLLFNVSNAKIPDRIVSLHKSYLRPIVRGKENKPVEFGMKAHMLQTDGITWFDTLDFKAYNECKRLKVSVIKHKAIFGKCHQVAGDRIYATNENRRYLTKHKIFHSFPQKGPNTLSKAEKLLKYELNKIRSTHLEGSFGNQKNNYDLRKIKAKNPQNERIWVFFAVMTENAIKITNRKIEAKRTSLQQAA